VQGIGHCGDPPLFFYKGKKRVKKNKYILAFLKQFLNFYKMQIHGFPEGGENPGGS